MSTKKKEIGYYSADEAGRMIYSTLIKPKKYKNKKTGKEEGEAKFSATFAYPKKSAAYAAIKAKMVEVAQAEFGEGVDIATVSLPRKNGDKLADARTAAQKADKDDARSKAMRGMFLIKASSKFPAKLGFFEKGDVIEIGQEEDEKRAKFAGKFYAGDMAYFTMNFKAGDGPKGPYVTAYLQEVLVTGKGERLPTGKSMAERFSKHVGKVSAEDPVDDEDEND